MEDGDGFLQVGFSPMTNTTVQDITASTLLVPPWRRHESWAQLALSPKAVNRQLHLVLLDLAVCAAVTVQKEANGVGGDLKLRAGADEAAAHGLALGSAPVKLHGNQPDDLVIANLHIK